MEQEKPKRGRPPKHSDRMRGNLTIRIRDRIRSELEKAAGHSGRSLSEEAEYRLEMDLHRRDRLVEEWGDDVFRMTDSFARMRHWVEDYTGKSWLTDEATFNLFRDGVVRLFDNYRARLLILRRDTRNGPVKGKSRDDLLEAFADLAGISPPRLTGSGSNPERDAAERRQNIAFWDSIHAQIRTEADVPADLGKTEDRVPAAANVPKPKTTRTKK